MSEMHHASACKSPEIHTQLVNILMRLQNIQEEQLLKIKVLLSTVTMKLTLVYMAQSIFAAHRRIILLRAHPLFLAEHIIQTQPAI